MLIGGHNRLRNHERPANDDEAKLSQARVGPSRKRQPAHAQSLGVFHQPGAQTGVVQRLQIWLLQLDVPLQQDGWILRPETQAQTGSSNDPCTSEIQTTLQGGK